MRRIRGFGCFVFGVLASMPAVLGGHGSTSDASSVSLSAQRIALGQRLFDDPLLSADGTLRCASCHRPDRRYSDGRAVAVGVYGRHGTRHTPSLFNVAAADEMAFFWDGRRASLEQAVLDPITNPVEMGLHDAAQMVRRIARSSDYGVAFARAFPPSHAALTPARVGTVLAAYVRSLQPPPSAFDRYLRGERAALPPRAQLGLALFQGKAGCASCHRLDGASPPLTDLAYHRASAGLQDIAADLPALTQGVVTRSLAGGALGERVASHADEAQLGRFNVTLQPADIGLFRTPSLRGVAHTAPYMHDGSVPTLEEAVEREWYGRGLPSRHAANLSVEDRQNLVEFLRSL